MKAGKRGVLHMKPQAVFFDLFETLITEFTNHARTSRRSYNYEELLGIPDEQFRQEWGSRQEQRMNGHYASYGEVIRDIAASRNLQVDQQVIESLYQQRMAEKRIPFEAIDSSISDMLVQLRKLDVKLGLISNCTEEEVRAWPESSLAALFDDALFSFEVRCSKPSIQIYSLACERLGVRPAECVFVGDGGSDELNGAARAGLAAYQAIWFNTSISSTYPQFARPLDLIVEIQKTIG